MGVDGRDLWIKTAACSGKAPDPEGVLCGYGETTSEFAFAKGSARSEFSVVGGVFGLFYCQFVEPFIVQVYDLRV